VLALDYLPLGLAYVKKNNVAILGHMQPKTWYRWDAVD
jgi:hypothetical protein